MSAIIKVKGLVAGYGDNVVLKDLNFEVERGEVFVILGGSGCGKRYGAQAHDRAESSARRRGVDRRG